MNMRKGRFPPVQVESSCPTVLAFFGALITHEDDPVRAVNAALDILKQIHQHRDEWHAARRVPDLNAAVQLYRQALDAASYQQVSAIGAESVRTPEQNIDSMQEQPSHPETVSLCSTRLAQRELSVQIVEAGGD